MLLLALPAAAISRSQTTNNSIYWQDLKAKLTNYLNKNLDQKRYQYQIIRPLRALDGYLGGSPKAEIKFERFNLNSRGSRKTILASAANPMKDSIPNVSIQVEVKNIITAWELKSPISRGTKITQAMLIEKRIPIESQYSRLYFTTAPINKTANRNLREGEILKVNMVKNTRLVSTGDTIKVSSGSGGISLEFPCKAMSSGDIGDVINIMCPDFEKKSHKAKIIGVGKAVMQ